MPSKLRTTLHIIIGGGCAFATYAALEMGFIFLTIACALAAIGNLGIAVYDIKEMVE